MWVQTCAIPLFAEALDTVPASGPLPDPGRDGSVVVVAFGAGAEGQAGIAGGEAWPAVLGILGARVAAGVPVDWRARSVERHGGRACRSACVPPRAPSRQKTHTRPVNSIH